MPDFIPYMNPILNILFIIDCFYAIYLLGLSTHLCAIESLIYRRVTLIWVIIITATFPLISSMNFDYYAKGLVVSPIEMVINYFYWDMGVGFIILFSLVSFHLSTKEGCYVNKRPS